MRNTKRILTYEEALSRAIVLCNKCEQCVPELTKKLESWGLQYGDISKIIRQLKEHRYIDDTRYARAFAHDKLLFSGWGRNKTIQTLRLKRLSREDIENAFDNIEEDEYNEVARRVIRSKIHLSSEGITTYNSRIKILKSAIQRGFEYQLAAKIINSILHEDSDTEMDQ